MIRWTSNIAGRLTGHVEHTCGDQPCDRPLTIDRRVRMTDGRKVRLEGTRHDGTPIHHYVDRSELPGGAR